MSQDPAPLDGLPGGRSFEDFAAGQVHEFGSVRVDEAEVLAFGRRYDPQPFHVDPAAAASSIFGGLIASGWHTCALFMRLYVDALLTGSTSQGSPGVEELRWLHPVRPGDTLSGRGRVLETRPSTSRPDRGTVVFQSEMSNQDGDVVMRMRAYGLFGRRSPTEGAD